MSYPWQPLAHPKMLTKQQAAEYLGISTRTLAREVSNGRLTVRYEQGATSEIAMLGFFA